MKYTHDDELGFSDELYSSSSKSYTLDSILSRNTGYTQLNAKLTSNTSVDLSLDLREKKNTVLFGSLYSRSSISLSKILTDYPNGVLISAVEAGEDLFYRLEQTVEPFSPTYFDAQYWEASHSGSAEPSHAQPQITAITISPPSVSFGQNWPDGSYENGYYTIFGTNTYVTGLTSQGYWSSHPQIRRSTEYGYGYLFGRMANIDTNVSSAHTRLHDILVWFRDYEQVYHDPIDGAEADGGFVAWTYRKDQLTTDPILSAKPYDRSNDNGHDNFLLTNWYSTGRYLDFASKSYAWMIMSGAPADNLAHYLAPIQAAAGQIASLWINDKTAIGIDFEQHEG